MNRTILTNPSQAIMDFRAYEATPGISVIVLPDAPVYTHVAVSDDFIRASGMKREDVIGKGHFDVFPKSPDDPNFTGEQNLKASFGYILKNKVPHEMAVQRYDIPNGDGTFSQRYWKINNAPILSDEGAVLYIVHSAVDVTEIVLREIQSRKTTQFLVDNSPIGIVIYEAIRDERGALADFRVKHYNKQSNDLAGVTAVERETLTYRQIATTLGHDLYDYFVAVVESGYTLKKEHFIQSTGKWVLYSGVKFEDGFLATLTDITELKRSQESLQQEVQFSKGIFDASLNGIYVLDAVVDSTGKVADFIFLQGNQKFSELTGWPVEKLVGQSFLGSFPASRQSGLFQMLCQVIESGDPYRQATYYAQTFQRWYDYMAVRLGLNKVVVTFQEITQIRESAMQLEQQKSLLDSILKHSPLGITVYTAIRNKEGRIVDFQCILANDAAEMFTQVSKQERLARTVLEITPALKDSVLFQMAVMAVETGKPFQTQYYHAEAGKWLELSVVKMYDDHLINVFMDITSTKQAQLQLEESIKSLKQSNEELEQFTYISHHDLQEPLRKIALFTDMIRSESYNNLTEASKKRFDKIADAARRMSVALKDVLNYASLNKEEQFKLVNLNEVVDTVMLDLEHVIAEKGGSISVDQLPVLRAIPPQMHQLFYNLVSNALKFSRPQQRLIIEIACRNVHPAELLQHQDLVTGKQYMEIVIRDNGIGFHQEAAEKIFSMFQRLHSKEAYAGTGIGLALCKKVVANHGGKIWAEGEEEKGATFTIWLPLD